VPLQLQIDDEILLNGSSQIKSRKEKKTARVEKKPIKFLSFDFTSSRN